MKQVKGHVGDLARWPEQHTSTTTASSSSSGGVGGKGDASVQRQVAGALTKDKDDLDMMITRHRPVWDREPGDDDDDDDGIDDYHAMMKKM